MSSVRLPTNIITIIQTIITINKINIVEIANIININIQPGHIAIINTNTVILRRNTIRQVIGISSTNTITTVTTTLTHLIDTTGIIRIAAIKRDIIINSAIKH
jgi:hypothetical protein